WHVSLPQKGTGGVKPRAFGTPNDVAGRINVCGARLHKALRKKCVQVHDAPRAAAPDQRVSVAPCSRTVAKSHLFLAVGGGSSRTGKPAGVEVHHAAGAAAPEQRVGGPRSGIAPSYSLSTGGPVSFGTGDRARVAVDC